MALWSSQQENLLLSQRWSWSKEASERSNFIATWCWTASDGPKTTLATLASSSGRAKSREVRQESGRWTRLATKSKRSVVWSRKRCKTIGNIWALNDVYRIHIKTYEHENQVSHQPRLWNYLCFDLGNGYVPCWIVLIQHRLLRIYTQRLKCKVNPILENWF